MDELHPLSFFTPEDIARGAHRALVVGISDGLELLLDAALLLAIAFGRPGRRLFEQLASRPRPGPLTRVLGEDWRQVALFLVVVGLLRGLLPFPVLLWRDHFDAHALGLSHEPLPSFLLRSLRGVVFASAGLALLGVGLGTVRRRWPRRWWLAVGVAGAVALVADAVIEPYWTRLDFEERPLDDGPLRDRIEALAQRTGADLGQVTVIDASRYGTRANAFVTGVGPTRRVVLTDTLLAKGDEAVVGAVAHEIGHRREERMPVRLALSCLALVGFLGFVEACLRFARRRGAPADAHALAFLLVAVTALNLAVLPLRAAFGRAEEREADALELAERADLDGYVRDQVELVRANALQPRPGWLGRLVASHPSAMERIERALEQKATR